MLKVKQQQIKARKNAEEAEIRALIDELQAQKEEELRARMERARLKQVLHGADQASLAALEQAKQQELQVLAQDREALATREANIMREIKDLEDKIVEQVCGRHGCCKSVCWHTQCVWWYRVVVMPLGMPPRAVGHGVTMMSTSSDDVVTSSRRLMPSSSCIRSASGLMPTRRVPPPGT